MTVLGGGGLAAKEDFERTVAFDAFGRLRVSEPTTLFESQFQYNLLPLLWETAITATGAAAHLPNESACEMSVSASGDECIRQTRQYFRYRPGKSQLLACTFVMGAGHANVRMRVGYFDANNGIFLQRAGSTVSLVRRTNTSGTPSDTATVAKGSWNIDNFDGTGPSKITLDLTKAQILLIDLQWLGVGRVRVGFDVDGVFYPAHQFLNANSLSTVYMTTANLPIRYEITATGAPGGKIVFKQICAMLASEGGAEIDLGVPRATGNGVTGIGVTTRRPICSIRANDVINSIANRGQIIIEGVELSAASNSSYWELVYGGTLTGASFSAVGDNSIADRDVAATAISGGEVIDAGFAVAGSGTVRGLADKSLLSKLPLTMDLAGTGYTNLSLVCTSFSGTSTVTGIIRWREIY